MKTTMTVIGILVIGAVLGYVISQHIATDCSPWLANIKLCGQVITK